MKYLINFALFFCLAFLLSCDGSGSQTNNVAEQDIDDLNEPQLNLDVVEERGGIPDASDEVVSLPTKHDCMVEGEVLEGNEQWFRGKSILVAITTDESTFDESLGESHRVLVAYDTENCSEVFKEVLPINISADYPYYLTPIDSIKGELVGILGADKFYVYDVTNNRLSKPLNPDFKSNRQLGDAQSGAIMGMETLGRYIIGYAEDEGSFVYNLTIPQTPKQETPFAEYKQGDGSYASLYLLKEQENNLQAVLPEYNLNERRFEVNPLLDEPAKVSQQVNKSALDNRYIVLRMEDADRSPIAIDMETSKRIELPADMKGKSTQEILEWMKKNSR